ncbi:MAG TPA: energy transducer TonB [Pyrinomonadaceae bacterium]|nr:energy transducer TonB [Pyrinomonadaceae bacterium]
MPLNVRRFSASVFITLFGFIIFSYAQAVPAPTASTTPENPQPAARTLTPAEVMRGRIDKAKAFIVVRNYPAAIYELETIRRETIDPSVHSVANVLLMNSYLEQGNYRRAQEFLAELFNSLKSNDPNAEALYAGVAGQIVKGARSQVERYRLLGLSIADRSLPLEAINDVEKMRETLELVVKQAREVKADNGRAAQLMPLLEEAAVARSLLARDEYDAGRWRNEIADAREQMAHSQSVVLSAIPDPAAPPVAETETEAEADEAETKERAASQAAKPSETALASTEKPVIVEKQPAERPVIVVGGEKASGSEEKKEGEAGSDPGPSGDGPIEAGSLIPFAVRQQAPIYPATARQLRATGVVRVEIKVDENGDVASIERVIGPTLLQGAARDAILRWKFKPFTRDGRPAQATGFVNFNFSL